MHFHALDFLRVEAGNESDINRTRLFTRRIGGLSVDIVILTKTLSNSPRLLYLNQSRKPGSSSSRGGESMGCDSVSSMRR
jgi:hypothetical protein